MVRMLLSGTEVVIRLSGSALKNLLALTLALARNHKKLSGKVNLGKMLRETRDLRQFSMTPEQYKEFQHRARKQKLLFATVRDRDGQGKLIDVILPVTELDRANQIFQRMLYQEPDRQPEAHTPERVRDEGAYGPEQGPAGASGGTHRDPTARQDTAEARHRAARAARRPHIRQICQKRVSVGTRLARYKNQLLYPPRPRNYD
ncbi:MAG: PcfB family protein [Flavonifractor plautii]